MRKILFAGYPALNSHIKLGIHHFVNKFKEHGWDVGYLSHFTNLKHFVKRGSDKALWGQLYSGDNTRAKGDIWQYSPFIFFPPCNVFPLNLKIYLDNYHRFIFPSLSRILSRSGFLIPDILFLNNVFYTFLPEIVRCSKLVVRVPDVYVHFERLPKKIFGKYARVLKKADLVIATSKIVEEWVCSLRGSSQGVIIIENGVDVSHFAPLAKESLPAEYPGLKKPIILYVGSIDKWFDLELDEKMAGFYRNSSVVIIGQPKIDLDILKKYPNVHLLGSRSYDLIPIYMRHADVGIIPFKRTPLINGVSPLKMYEYFASGLPVVSIRWDELERIKPPALMADTHEEFIALIKKAVSSGKRHSFIDFASQNTWEERYQRLICLT